MILSVIVDLDAILLPGVHPPILPFLHSHLPSSNHQELFLNPKSSFQSAHPDSPLAYPMIITSPCSRQFRETKIPSLCHPTKVIDESSWYKGRVSILSRTATAIRILFLPLLQIPWTYGLQEYLTAACYSRLFPRLKLMKKPLCLSWQHTILLKSYTNPLVKRKQLTVIWGQHNQVTTPQIAKALNQKKEGG